MSIPQWNKKADRRQAGDIPSYKNTTEYALRVMKKGTLPNLKNLSKRIATDERLKAVFNDRSNTSKGNRTDGQVKPKNLKKEEVNVFT